MLFFEPRHRTALPPDLCFSFESSAETSDVFMAERELRRYMAFPQKDAKHRTWKDISITDAMPAVWRKKFEALHTMRARVFDESLEVEQSSRK